MKAQRPGGGWVNQNYDKLLLMVVLVALLVSAVILVMKISSNRRALEEVLRAPEGDVAKKAAVQDMDSYRKALELLKNPFQVGPQNRRMMVGELRVSCVKCGRPIPFNATVCPFDGAAQPTVDYDPDSDGDGISDRVELTNGLNPTDPSDAHGDADGDGFTNLEEIQFKTSLHEAKEFPPPSAKLRLVRVVTNPFKLRFLGISKLADADRYQLNLRTLERTYFPKMGDVVEGYKVLSYDDKAAGGPTLSLQKGDSVIKLIQGRVIDTEARTAVLVFLIDGSVLRVQVDSPMKLRDAEYKVIDIRDDRVLIRDEQAGKDATISLLTDDERIKLQGQGDAGTPAQAPAAGSSPTVQ